MEPKIRRQLAAKLKHLSRIRLKLGSQDSRRHRVIKPRDNTRRKARMQAVRATLRACRNKT